jgi:ATP-dependent RNA helicase RhlE
VQDTRVTFDALGLDAPLLRAVREAGYTVPTPIQVAAIPPALLGRDIVGCAQTGTGKTAAFALPILQLLDARAGDEPRLRALVLTPTRELAAQIAESLRVYGRHLDLWHTVIFGGVNEGPQKTELRRGVDALVATPGRLLDLMNQGVVSLDSIELFVLDEADRMLDMGFIHDVERVTRALPAKRQTLFFSATMPASIRALADRLLNDPVSVAVAPISAPAERVEQRLYLVDKANKRDLLLELLDDASITRSLVFSRTKHGANRIAQVLDRAGVKSAAIHGNKSQSARTRALESFRNGDLRVLVATDLAARGLDVDDVTHVINFDLPDVPETYVHRIGRTARASATGVALSFCDVDERENLADIERLIGRHIDRVDDHRFLPTQPPPAATDLRSRAPANPSRSGPGAPRGQTRKGRPRRGRAGGPSASPRRR